MKPVKKLIFIFSVIGNLLLLSCSKKEEQLKRYLTYYFRHMYGPFHLASLQCHKDIETIDSAYLCKNIEWSFKVWQEQPWGKHVSFTDFCEYILPHRIGDETLTDWREEIYQKYNPLLDSIRGGASVFTTTAPAELPHVGPRIVQLKSGSCCENSDFVVYVCRALGIPCAIDFMPLRGDENDSHQWVSFADKYGTLFYQEFPDYLREVRKDRMCGMPKIKVYRNTYSLNHEMQQEIQKLDTVVVPLFQDPHIVDVTFSYTKDF